MTAIPNQHWGGENRTSVSRFVTSIVASKTSFNGCLRLTCLIPKGGGGTPYNNLIGIARK